MNMGLGFGHHFDHYYYYHHYYHYHYFPPRQDRVDLLRGYQMETIVGFRGRFGAGREGRGCCFWWNGKSGGIVDHFVHDEHYYDYYYCYYCYYFDDRRTQTIDVVDHRYHWIGMIRVGRIVDKDRSTVDCQDQNLNHFDH